jgi:hypothetical protein
VDAPEPAAFVAILLQPLAFVLGAGLVAAVSTARTTEPEPTLDGAARPA